MDNIIKSMGNEDVYNDNIENIKLTNNPKSDNVKNLLILLTILLIILTISIFIAKFILNNSEKVETPFTRDNIELNNIDFNKETKRIDDIKYKNYETINLISEKEKEKIVTKVISNPINKPVSTILPSDNFYIKIASLSQEPTKSYLSKIRRVGFSYKLVHVIKSNKPLVRVLIGPFLSKKSAYNNLKFIKKRFSKSAYVTKMN